MIPTAGDDAPPTKSERVNALRARLEARWPASKAYTRLDRTRLCVDGPPRSANSLLVHKLYLSNREFMRPAGAVAHHTHDPESVLLATLRRIPVIMPLRTPQDALASFAVYQAGDDLAAACQAYQRMCHVVLGDPQWPLIASFETILNDVNRLLRVANQRFSLGLEELPMTDAEANRIIAERVAESALKTHGDNWSTKVGQPNEDRRRAKSDAMARLAEEPQVATCQRLFERVMVDCTVV